MHFWFKQARSNGHSELLTHSGLQVGGLPINPGTQEQTAWPFIALHWLLGPQGDGLQGFLAGAAENIFIEEGFSLLVTHKDLRGAGEQRINAFPV